MFTNKKQNTIIDIQVRQKIIFWVSLICLGIGAFVYLILIRGVVVGVVERESLTNNITTLTDRISELETEYLRAKESITLDIASAKGFIEPVQKHFASDRARTPSLSVNLNP